MRTIYKYISNFDVFNGNTKLLEEQIKMNSQKINSIEIVASKVEDAESRAKFEGKPNGYYIPFLKYQRFFLDVNEDYKVYSKEDLEHLSVEEDCLYKTRELISLNSYELLPIKSELGLSLKRGEVYYSAFNEYIAPLHLDYLIKLLQKHYNSSFIRVAKNYKSIEEPKTYLTCGAIKPLLWAFDKTFKKKNHDGIYNTEYKNDLIPSVEYKRIWKHCNSFYPSTEYKTDVSISNYGNLDILIEELHKTPTGVVGKCIHITLDKVNEVWNDKCDHIDFSINLYDKSTERFSYGLNQKLEACKRIHFFRINNTFEFNELPELLINLFDIKSNIYEILFDLENLDEFCDK